MELDQDKIVGIIFGVAIATPISLGLWVSTLVEISSEIMVLFLMTAGILTSQVYILYEIYTVKKRLFNITTEKDAEDKTEEAEVTEDEPEE